MENIVNTTSNFYYLTDLPNSNGNVLAGKDIVLSVTTKSEEALDHLLYTTLPSYEIMRIEPHVEIVETGEQVPTGKYSFYLEGYGIAYDLDWRYSLKLAEYLTTTNPFMALFEMSYRRLREYMDDIRRDGAVFRVRKGRYPVYLAIGRAKPTYIYELQQEGIPVLTQYELTTTISPTRTVTVHRGSGIGSAFCFVTTSTEAFIPMSKWLLSQRYVESVDKLYEFSRW